MATRVRRVSAQVSDIALNGRERPVACFSQKLFRPGNFPHTSANKAGHAAVFAFTGGRRHRYLPGLPVADNAKLEGLFRGLLNGFNQRKPV